MTNMLKNAVRSGLVFRGEDQGLTFIPDYAKLCANNESFDGGGMKTILVILLGALGAVVSYGVPVNFYDDFETLYSEGKTFVTATNGWQASSTAAYVTNSAGYTNSKAAFMGEIVALTNSVNGDANLKVWTDFRIKPALGLEAPGLATNVSSFLSYFNTNGVMLVAATNGQWRVCTNDIWGNSVPPATNNAYVRVSFFQDFGTSNQAVFLNDQLILQDLPFVGSAVAYNRFVIRNTDSNCWLDNVWISTNVPGLTSNRNGDAVADAEEVHLYGHARRTLYVCQSPTNLVPRYTTITNALADWRARDIIHVVAGPYSGESITLSANPSNVVFEGDAFTVSNLTVASNALASFAQSVSCGTLTVSGQVAMVSGASLTSTTAHVIGTLLAAGGGVFMVTNLDVGVSGAVNAGTVAQSVTMTGNAAFGGQIISASNLVVVSGANATFAQSVNCGILSLTGQVTMASGMSLTSTTSHVVGSLSVSGNGALVVTNLDFGPAGVVNANNASLVASAAGVVVNGTFAITGTSLGSSFGNLTLSGNAAFSGQGFSVSNMTVVSGASVTFAQSVNCVNSLTLTGQVALANGVSLTSGTVNVTGSLSISSNGAFVVTNLTMSASGVVMIAANASLAAITAGVTMGGPFAISNNVWSTAAVVSMPLPFSDDFELYGQGTVITNLKFRGWYASDGTVTIQTNQGAGGSKAVVVPEGTSLSNSISEAAATNKVWTDYYVKPVWGMAPFSPRTNYSSFLAYVNTNGNLVVATNGGGWVVCSNQWDNLPAPVVQSNAYTRLSICQDLSFSPPKFAVFIAGKLVAQELVSPANITRYSSFVANNRDGVAAFDQMLISTTLPSGLTNDMNLNGLSDAYEVNTIGYIRVYPRGSIYAIR